jgi:hypothetical protein
MTVLLNYRFYSSNIRRNPTMDKRARKMFPMTKRKLSHSRSRSRSRSPSRSGSPLAVKEFSVPVTPPPSPMMGPLVAPLAPSAPPAIYTKRHITVNDRTYEVELPHDYDIYEGLRRWYPALYEAVMEEERYVEQIALDNYEAAWAHYDYLESMYD